MLVVNVSLSFLLLLSILGIRSLASCSKRSCPFENYKSLQLTTQSILEFSRQLKDGPTSPFIAELRNHINDHGPCHNLCLKYLFGSVAIFGKVDEDDLTVLLETYDEGFIFYMSRLLESLIESNCLETVVRFIVNDAKDPTFKAYKNVFLELVEDNWDVMLTLIRPILDLSKEDEDSPTTCIFMTSYLPIERQYEVFRSGMVHIDVLDNYRSVETNLYSVLELFSMARCSYNPSPEIRGHIASRSMLWKHLFMPEPAPKSTMTCRPEDVPQLKDALWLHVFKFSDAETVILVLPLVCTLWRNLHSRALTNSTKAHLWYFYELHDTGLSEVHTVSPWKYCLSSAPNAFKYFGRCIADDEALRQVSSLRKQPENMREYIKAVIGGKVAIPEIPGCATQRDAFMKLFEIICGFLYKGKPLVGKPDFLTDEEYEWVTHQSMH